jgi:pre-mRNA-splicing factor 18
MLKFLFVLINKSGTKKFFKRGELEQRQTQLYIEKNFAAHKANEDASDDDKKKGTSSKHDKSKLKELKDEETEKKVLPRNEVIRRLRERNQPIRFFGESDLDAAKRLTLIETSEPKENGMRNDFKAAMDKSEQESLNEIMNSIDSGDSAGSNRTECDIKEEAIDFDEILVNYYFLLIALIRKKINKNLEISFISFMQDKLIFKKNLM